MATSLSAHEGPEGSHPSASTVRAPLSSMVNSPLCSAFMQASMSQGVTSARKPSLPMLTPTMGICFVPTRAAAFRNVPSPPMDITKSASKSPSSKTRATPWALQPLRCMKS